MLVLERNILNVENFLSDVSFYPVIGTLAGAGKIAMGGVQLITSVATALLLAIPAVMTVPKNPMRQAFLFSCRHIIHGAGNIAAGVIESIPIVQSILYGYRYIKYCPDLSSSIRSFQENKFMGYKLVAEEDTRIVSLDDEFKGPDGKPTDEITIEQGKKTGDYSRVSKNPGYPWIMV